MKLGPPAEHIASEEIMAVGGEILHFVVFFHILF